MKANNLRDNCPEIANEWHPTKNENLKPEDITTGSNMKLWWLGKCGHEWIATPKQRTVGHSSCPYCSNKKVLRGFNDLATTNPRLAAEWHPTKNGMLTPNDLVEGSNKIVWWQCKYGHEWQSRIVARLKGVGCPYCSNKKVLIGYNDLATTDPDLAKEWHPSKNLPLKPTDLTHGAGIKVWWICEKGHEWIATPNKRTAEHTGCPYCSNQKVLRGFNDLATTNPRLAAEWHPTKNGKLTPYEIVEGSARKVWWKCNKGHEWQAAPYNRIKNRNCPICSKQLHTSFPEQAIYFYIKKYFCDAENSNTEEIGMELDIYIPSIKTAIEYDGVFYHKGNHSTQKEKEKNNKCRNKGIRLIRVREKGLNTYHDCECIISEKPDDYTSISLAVDALLRLLGVKKFKIDIDKDLSSILEMYLSSSVNNNLSVIDPNLASQWHPTKNGKLQPEHLSANSGKKVWWVCEKGHEWQASLHNRMKGKGCPYCSGRVSIIGKTDLQTCFPELVKEWNYDKNKGIMPTEFKQGSNKKVWWKCRVCGYEWETAICNRTNGHGCPKCGELKKGPKRKTHEQFQNELRIINPNISLIDSYTVSTNKIKCHCLICGHEWYALPGNLLKGKGCPECARKKRKSKNG